MFSLLEGECLRQKPISKPGLIFVISHASTMPNGMAAFCGRDRYLGGSISCLMALAKCLVRHSFYLSLDSCY